MVTTSQQIRMSNPFTRRRCWALTAFPILGVGLTASIESLGLAQTEAIRLVLYLGFVMALLGGGLAFLAWGKYLQTHGSIGLGMVLERGVGILFVSWLGWATLAEFTHVLPHSLAVLESLFLGTAVIVDAALAVLNDSYEVDLGERQPTAHGILVGSFLLVFTVLWLVFSQQWTTVSLVALIAALGILGHQIVRLTQQTEDTPAHST